MWLFLIMNKQLHCGDFKRIVKFLSIKIFPFIVMQNSADMCEFSDCAHTYIEYILLIQFQSWLYDKR